MGISPGKNTGVDCHALLQGIFVTQGLNPGLLQLLHWEADALPLSHLGSPLGPQEYPRSLTGELSPRRLDVQPIGIGCDAALSQPQMISGLGFVLSYP